MKEKLELVMGFFWIIIAIVFMNGWGGVGFDELVVCSSLFILGLGCVIYSIYANKGK
ncbi:unnamed protein product [marine sediment metagenome]|uniref:Uncharacterized protein n=1 Tax=marine sediment metagenome TaxID=412755 RepID=X1V7C1_9ZZZZ